MIRFALALAFVLAAIEAALPAQSPGPVTLTLRIADGRRQFRPGEVIPIELTFNSNVPNRFVVDSADYDRSGRLTIDQFRIAPINAVTDPMLDYYSAISGGIIGGGLRGMGRLGEKPFTVTLELNQWFRFDTPGTFTLSVRSDRVTDEVNRQPRSQPTVPVESNTITFQVLPRNEQWEAAELERALQILSRPRQPGWRTGCLIPRFLGTRAAVDEMIRRIGDDACSFDFMAGLYGAPDRTYVVQRLEAGIAAPDQVVTQSYLRTLAVLSVYTQQPSLRPPQTAAAKGRLNVGGELARRPELVEFEMERYAQMLEAALATKTGAARAVSTADHLATVRSRAAAGSTPVAAAESVRRQLIASFSDLPASRQERLLSYEWQTVADVALVPALRQLASGSTGLADFALRRLYQLAPDEGRARILATIRKPHPGSTLKTLGALPEVTLPELDEDLARSADPNNPLGFGLALVYRYASPAVASRIRQAIVPAVGQFACVPQNYALAYFLRVSPQEGIALVERALAARGKTNCYQFLLNETARLRMTPGLESLMITALDDEHPRVVQNAIEALGEFGSPAALPVLRSHFDSWQRVWRGRANELRVTQLAAPGDPGVANGAIEMAYLRALATGRGWLTDGGDIAALREWCVTDGCRSSADDFLRQAGDTTIDISRFEAFDDLTAQIAQYRLDSLPSLTRKLSQYPRGTSFMLRMTDGDPVQRRTLTAELRAWATKQGFAVRAGD